MKNIFAKIVWTQNELLHKDSMELCGAKAKIFNGRLGIQNILSTAKRIGKQSQTEITKILVALDEEQEIFTCVNGQCDALLQFIKQ